MHGNNKSCGLQREEKPHAAQERGSSHSRHWKNAGPGMSNWEGGSKKWRIPRVKERNGSESLYKTRSHSGKENENISRKNRRKPVPPGGEPHVRKGEEKNPEDVTPKQEDTWSRESKKEVHLQKAAGMSKGTRGKDRRARLAAWTPKKGRYLAF